MECTRCGQYDFDVVRTNLIHLPYLECFHCRQGYLVYDNLHLRYAEIIGDVPDDLDGTVMFTCQQCHALRFAQEGKNELVRSVQFCNRCLDDAKNSGDVTVRAGEKISWEEFAKTVESLS